MAFPSRLSSNFCGPANRHYGGEYVDVFPVKMDPLEFEEGAIALYDDVPEAERRVWVCGAIVGG